MRSFFFCYCHRKFFLFCCSIISKSISCFALSFVVAICNTVQPPHSTQFYLQLIVFSFLLFVAHIDALLVVAVLFFHTNRIFPRSWLFNTLLLIFCTKPIYNELFLYSPIIYIFNYKVPFSYRYSISTLLICTKWYYYMNVLFDLSI